MPHLYPTDRDLTSLDWANFGLFHVGTVTTLSESRITDVKNWRIFKTNSNIWIQIPLQQFDDIIKIGLVKLLYQSLQNIHLWYLTIFQ